MNASSTKAALAVAAGLAISCTAAAQQIATPTAQGTGPEGSVNGPQAVRQIGDNIAKIAAEYSLTAEGLAQLMTTKITSSGTEATVTADCRGRRPPM